MRFITVSELRLNAARVIRDIGGKRQSFVVTKNGKPVDVIRAVEGSEFILKKRSGLKHRNK